MKALPFTLLPATLLPATLLPATLLLALTLSTASCKKSEAPAPTAWDKPTTTAGGSAAKPTPGAPPSAPGVTPAGSASIAKAVDGTAFSPFFPDKGMDDTTDKVAKPVKGGMAEVVYKKGKDDVISIVISDTQATPAVRDDYKDATDKVATFPLKTSGNYKSAILVANRYQVAATSQRLKPEDRKKWLEKVDLAGLAKLN